MKHRQAEFQSKLGKSAFARKVLTKLETEYKEHPLLKCL